MKKLITVVVFGIAILGFTNSAFSQNKIGYISTEELIGAMPEAETATNQLRDYQSALQQQGADMQAELQEKDSVFQRDSLKMSQSTKDLKRADLIALYQKLSGWNNVMQQKMQEKQQELLVPIRNKAVENIKAVAKENGYTYILDQNSVIAGPPGDDVLALVKKKLNINPPAAKTPAAKTPAATKPK